MASEGGGSELGGTWRTHRGIPSRCNSLRTPRRTLKLSTTAVVKQSIDNNSEAQNQVSPLQEIRPIDAVFCAFTFGSFSFLFYGPNSSTLSRVPVASPFFPQAVFVLHRTCDAENLWCICPSTNVSSDELERIQDGGRRAQFLFFLGGGIPTQISLTLTSKRKNFTRAAQSQEDHIS